MSDPTPMDPPIDEAALMALRARVAELDRAHNETHADAQRYYQRALAAESALASLREKYDRDVSNREIEVQLAESALASARALFRTAPTEHSGAMQHRSWEIRWRDWLASHPEPAPVEEKKP